MNNDQNPTFLGSLSEDQAQQLIASAAIITGRPASEITTQDAITILEERGHKMPTYNEKADIAAAILWAYLNANQLKRILSAEDAEAAILSAVENLTQKAQEDITEQEAQEAYKRDIEALQDAMAAASGEEIKDRLKDRLQEAVSIDDLRELAAGVKGAFTQNNIAKTITETAREALAGITAFLQSETYRNIKDNMQAFNKFLEESRAKYETLAAAGADFQDLLPFLQMELDEARENNDPDYADCILEDVLLYGYDDNFQPTDSIFRPLIERARQKLEEHRAITEAVEEIEQAAEELPRINYHNSKQVKTVTDKWMNFFYSFNAPMPKGIIDGQRAMLPLKYENSKSKNEITLWYDYEYNDEALSRVGVPKGFSGYDYFIATTLDNLKEGGNDKVSYSKILDEMGIDPAQKNIEKLAKALVKGATTTIFVNDSEVQKAWGNKNYHEIISRVLPITIGNERAIANGFVTDGIIEIDNFSPFRRLAGDLKHLTQWKKEIFLLYKGRKTDRYWNVLQVLIREIGWMRNSNKRKPKILYSLFYIQNGDKTPRDKQNTRAMIYRLLEEVFKPAGYVRSFEEDNSTEPGVILKVVKNGGLLTE